MIKRWLTLCFAGLSALLLCGVSLTGAAQSAPSEPAVSLPWQPLQGRISFSQLKQLQGLPVPLNSSGYLEITPEQMLWHTTAPVDSKLLISASGVSQWQQQEYVAVAGSEFVGQLMLAVLQQDNAFIAEQFSVAKAEAPCLALTPRQAPLDQLFRQILLCGSAQLSQLKLEELNGNTTSINLQPEPASE